MSSYTTLQGDTFDLIARKVYGVDSESARIQRANPGISEPLTAGTKLHIPSQIDAPKNRTQENAEESENKVSIFIDNEKFNEWTEVSITKSIDAVATVTLVCVFDITNLEQVKLFKPFSYKDVRIVIGSEDVFNGTLLNPTPTIDDLSATISVSAYSLPGVLQDCMPSSNAYPLEFEGQTLQEIAATLLDPFGISTSFVNKPGAVFKRVACKPSQTVLSFLIDLAQQRNLLISSGPDGSLVFQRSVAPGQPVARLEQNKSPLMSVTPRFNAQKYFSHITTIEPVLIGLPGSTFVKQNSGFDLAKFRPFTFNAPDTFNPDLEAAVDSKMGRMFANSVSYEIQISSWRNEKTGEVWKENTTITLQSVQAFIFEEYEFTIRDVMLSKNADEEMATLNLIFTGAFRGEIPEVLPWDT